MANLLLMSINNFSSFIELSATLNIAFVVVEYAKSYTSIIAKDVFRFQNRIENSVEKCISLIDKDTINNLSDININGCSTFSEVQRVKREYNNLSVDITALRSELELLTTDRCQSKSFSFISLYLFLFSLTALFIAGFTESAFIYTQWITFSILSLVFIFVCWAFGEKPQKRLPLYYSSLSCCIYTFVGILGFSVVLGIIPGLDEYLKLGWNYSIITTVLLPYANFFIFTAKIKLRARNLYKEIDDRILPIKCKFEKLKGDVNVLVDTQNLSSKLSEKINEDMLANKKIVVTRDRTRKTYYR